MPHSGKLDQLQKDMARLGISHQDLDVPMQKLVESTRALSRVESAQILSRKFLQRDKVKQRMVENHHGFLDRLARARERRVSKWVQKTSRSPFLIDLMADDQRIDEENKVRLQEEYKKHKLVEKRRRQAKQEIVLKALGETSDLEALRREKRAIIDEERRLKALLDLEKNKLHTKEDFMAAVHADRQRREAKELYARKQRIQMFEEEKQAEHAILKEFLDVKDAPDNTFASYAGPPNRQP